MRWLGGLSVITKVIRLAFTSTQIPRISHYLTLTFKQYNMEAQYQWNTNRNVHTSYSCNGVDSNNLRQPRSYLCPELQICSSVTGDILRAALCGQQQANTALTDIPAQPTCCSDCSQTGEPECCRSAELSPLVVEYEHVTNASSTTLLKALQCIDFKLAVLVFKMYGSAPTTPTSFNDQRALRLVRVCSQPHITALNVPLTHRPIATVCPMYRWLLTVSDRVFPVVYGWNSVPLRHLRLRLVKSSLYIVTFLSFL